MKYLISTTKDFINQLLKNRNLIKDLTRRDFHSKYIQNYFGLAWAIMDPLFFILILFFVFSVRYGDKQVLGTAFINYFICGYIAYNFFNNTITQLCGSIKSYSYLIKKVDFHSAIIPIFKILSQVAMHAIIIIIAVIILWINGEPPQFIIIQIFYYTFAICMLLLGLGWITASIYPFFPDIKNIVGIISRILFFLTPIFWSIDGLPERIATILKFNPLYYIATGYRESLVYGVPFWHHPRLTLYYWGITIGLIVIGIFVFKRLRPHFADVI